MTTGEMIIFTEMTASEEPAGAFISAESGERYFVPWSSVVIAHIAEAKAGTAERGPDPPLAVNRVRGATGEADAAVNVARRQPRRARRSR